MSLSLFLMELRGERGSLPCQGAPLSEQMLSFRPALPFPPESGRTSIFKTWRELKISFFFPLHKVRKSVLSPNTLITGIHPDLQGQGNSSDSCSAGDGNNSRHREAAGNFPPDSHTQEQEPGGALSTKTQLEVVSGGISLGIMRMEGLELQPLCLIKGNLFVPAPR